MIQTRRFILDMLREGPVLFAGLPGEEVDFDGLTAYLIERGIEGAIYATDGSLAGLLWIQQGAPGETWLFEVAGQEAVLPITASRDLFLDIAARGGAISVFVGAQPDNLTAHFASGTGEPGSSLFVTGPMAAVEASVSTISVEPRVPVDGAGATTVAAAVSPPAAPPPAAFEGPPISAVAAAGVPSVTHPPAGPRDADQPVADQPPTDRPGADPPAADPPAAVRPHFWQAVLLEVRARVARYRGPKLAAQFTAALSAALGEHGGRVDGELIVAPPLPDTAWRALIEVACAPVAAVAGRSFVDKTVAAAERAAVDMSRHLEERR